MSAHRHHEDHCVVDGGADGQDRTVRIKLIASLAALTLLTGCLQHHEGETATWFASNGGVPPRTDRVTVCHGFGCHL
ncbi:MAG: hypothetical protein AAFW98_15990, partial [Pseudomonadota bacterium]